MQQRAAEVVQVAEETPFLCKMFEDVSRYDDCQRIGCKGFALFHYALNWAQPCRSPQHGRIVADN